MRSWGGGERGRNQPNAICKLIAKQNLNNAGEVSNFLPNEVQGAKAFMALQTHFQLLKSRHREVKNLAWSHTASKRVIWTQTLTGTPPSVWPSCPMLVIKNTPTEICYHSCTAWWSCRNGTCPYELPPNWQNKSLLEALHISSNHHLPSPREPLSWPLTDLMSFTLRIIFSHPAPKDASVHFKW